MRRLRDVKMGDVILATTDLAADDRLAEVVEAEGVPVFRGADADVVARYVAAAERFDFDTVVRVTADCPFIDAELVDWCINRVAGFDHFDIATTKGEFPVGLDAEIYSAGLMATLNANDRLTVSEREHLTLHLYNHCNEYAVRAVSPPSAWPHTKRQFTVDTATDYENSIALVEKLGCSDFSISEMLKSIQ